MKFLFHAHYTPLLVLNKKCGPPILFKVVLASLEVAFATSTVPSLEIPSYS
jgi:hypothetical protein